MISVIIPVYNTQDYIEHCVRSVLSQTYSDLQVILVDDGSPDDSGRIIDAFEDPRVLVIHQENGGLSAARNTGLDNATGEYIGFIDGDDFVEPDMFETLLGAMDSAQADIAQCGYIADDLTVGEFDRGDGKIRVFDRDDAILSLVRNDVFEQVVWNKLYKREVIGDIRFHVGKFHEDEFFSWRVFYNSKKIADINRICYHYVQRAGSIMGQKFSAKRLHALEALLERTKEFKTLLPAIYPASNAALGENCIYQYQCFQRMKGSDDDGSCRRQIVGYYRQMDLPAACKAVSVKQGIWLRMFRAAPEMTAALRNKLGIGL
ncbi:MAG: glycosyltransferase [Clostridia bacterium]|nr:glycosyltransferase [Clostridia bacterium]